MEEYEKHYPDTLAYLELSKKNIKTSHLKKEPYLVFLFDLIWDFMARSTH